LVYQGAVVFEGAGAAELHGRRVEPGVVLVLYEAFNLYR